MKFKELLTVLDSNAYLDIVSEKRLQCMKAKLSLHHPISMKEQLN